MKEPVRPVGAQGVGVDPIGKDVVQAPCGRDLTRFRLGELDEPLAVEAGLDERKQSIATVGTQVPVHYPGGVVVFVEEDVGRAEINVNQIRTCEDLGRRRVRGESDELAQHLAGPMVLWSEEIEDAVGINVLREPLRH